MSTRNTTTQKFIHNKYHDPKIEINITEIKHLILKTVLKHLIFCVAYHKIEQVVEVGLIVLVVGWSSLTSLFIKAKVLTDGLGPIGLIYKLSGQNFNFSLKWRVKMEDSDSHNEFLKTHFLQGRKRSLPQRKLNMNIFERRLSLSEKVHKLSGQVENADFSDIADFYFSNFYKSVFSIFTCSEYRKLGSKKIRDFQTSVFSIFTYSEYRKLGSKKIRDFQTSVFSIFTYSEYRKLGSKKIRDFQTSVFSIFTIGEYRKHGCLKISDFFKSQFSIFTRQMSENLRFSNIRVVDIVNIENTDVRKSRIFKIQVFDIN